MKSKWEYFLVLSHQVILSSPTDSFTVKALPKPRENVRMDTISTPIPVIVDQPPSLLRILSQLRPQRAWKSATPVDTDLTQEISAISKFFFLCHTLMNIK